MARAFFGGIHPNDMKAATKTKAIEQLPPPAQVIIPMSQHFGSPCTPVVKVGDYVRIGQKIGEPGEGVSAAVHASVSGTVKAVEPCPCSQGGNMMAVVIENDFKNAVSEEVKPPADPELLTPEQLVECVKNAGIVGMGGTGFPTHIKIADTIGKVDTVIVNGAECEPYLTAEHRIMLERPEEIVGGCQYLAKMFHVDKVIIGVELNKKDGINMLNKVIAIKRAPVVVQPLQCRYPQGSEKQLCQSITGRQVPPGELPVEIGCVVFNINSVCAIYRAVTTGMPVVKKVVTVAGSGVIHPKNLECPVGAPVADLFDACDGLKDKTYKLIMGGPMRGVALESAEVPVNKGTGGLLAFAGREEKRVRNPHCIRCGKCVAVCPMNLQPVFLYRYAVQDRLDDLEDANVMDCVECGACTYVCPGRLNLTQMFRESKQRLEEQWAAQQAADESEAAAEKEA